MLILCFNALISWDIKEIKLTRRKMCSKIAVNLKTKNSGEKKLGMPVGMEEML